MNRALPVLDNLRVASPCDASWNDMAGDEARRFCDSCEKNVYDLTVLEPSEIVDLIERTEGKFCGRLYQRTDGRVLTDDCPVGVARLVRHAKRKTLRAAALAVTLAGSLISALAYRSFLDARVFGPDTVIGNTIEVIETVTPPPLPPPRHIVAGKIAVPPPPPEPEHLMGDIIVEEIEMGEVEALVE